MSFGINVLGRNVIEVGADASGYNKEIGKIENEAGKRGSLIGRTFSFGISKYAAIGIGAVTAGITGLGAAALKTGIGYNSLQQASRAALTTILGGAEAANAQMDKLDEFARNSPFAKQVFIKAQQQLLGFGLAADKVLPALDAVQNSVAAVGGTNDDIANVTYALAQMKGQGKLTGETLNQLGQYGIDAATILGKQLGKTGQEIRDMASKPGGIPVEKVWDPLVTGLEERFGGAASNVKGTWVGATDRIKAAWRDIGATIAEPFVGHKGGGLAIEWANKLADSMRALQKQLPPIMDALMPRLSGGLSQVSPMLDRLTAAIKRIDPAKIVALFDTFDRGKERIAPVADALVKLGKSTAGQVFSDLASTGKFLAFTVLPPLVDGFQWALDHFPFLHTEGMTLSGVLGSDGLAGSLTLGVEALLAWKAASMGFGAIKDTVDGVNKKYQDLRDTVDKLRGAQKDHCKEQKDCLDEQNSKLTTLSDNIKKVAGKTVQVPVKVVPPAQEALSGVARGIATGLSAGLTGAMMGAMAGKSLMGSLLPAIMPFLGPALIAVAIAGVALFAWHFRHQIADFFTKTLPDFFRTTVPAAFATLTATISDFLTKTLPNFLHMLPYWFGYYGTLALAAIVNFGYDAVSGIATGLGKLVDVAAGAFGAVWSWISTEVPTWPGRIWGFLSSLPGLLGDLLKQAYDWSTAQLSALWTWIKTEVPAWPAQFIGFLAGLPDLARTLWGWVQTRAVEQLTGLWTWIKTELPTWPGKFAGFLEELPGKMLDMAKRAADSFLDPFHKLKGWLGEALNNALEPLRQFARGANKALEEIGSSLRIPESWFTIEVGKNQGGGNLAALPQAAIRGYRTGGWMGRGGPELVRTGEDGPRWPELAVPTNPAYRKRAAALIAQLPRDMLPQGVDIGPGRYGRGGVADAVSGALRGITSLAGNAASTVLDWTGKGAKWVWDNVIMNGVGDITGPGMIGALVKGAGSKLFGSGLDFFTQLLSKASGLLPALGPGILSGQGIAAGGWFRPLLSYVITQLFGPASGALGYSFHTGIDLAAPTGSPVYAARAGTVTLSGWYDGYGNAIAINHGGGWATLYGHNSQLLVGRGAQVLGGQLIARVGSTGNSTGPHSHFETLFNGSPVNPRGVVAMGNGGWIREPVVGLGASGTRYLFGERGDEEVVPGGRPSTIVNVYPRTADMDEEKLVRLLRRIEARYGR